MRYCKISLKPVKSTSKYQDYQDGEFRKLFGSLKTNPVLAFTRKDFFLQSPFESRGMSISGIQQKLSLKTNQSHELEMTQSGGQYILKPSPEAFLNASENEHCAMLSSRLLGIKTADCGLVSFPDGELVYLTKRFDRKNNRKIHQEDLVQGFGLKSEEKYSQSYEAAGKLIDKMTNGKAAVVLDFFQRVLHAYLIGNDDLHLKNISLQKFSGNTGLYYDRLTPNYDCLFTHAFEHTSTSDALALDLMIDEKESFFSDWYDKFGFYTGYDFTLLGKRLGLREKPVKESIQAFIQKKELIVNMIDCCFMPEDMKKKAVHIVKDRSKALGIE